MLNLQQQTILLDRDGVINIDSDMYIKSSEEWHPIPGSLEAIARLTHAGFNVYVVTNQSGIGRGLFTINDLNAMHQKMRTLLEQFGGKITDIVYCPHSPDEGCTCRKPNIGLLEQLRQRHNLNFSQVPFVGDSLKDLDCAAAVGAIGHLVLTGKGQKTLAKLKNLQYERLKTVPVYPNLAHAVDDWLKR